MKKSIIIIAAIFMTAFTTKVMAQITGVTIPNTAAGAEIVAELTLQQVTSLQFGRIGAGALGGNCVLTTGAQRQADGDLNVSLTTTVTNAVYNATGQAAYSYKITLPTSINVIDGASHSMNIDDLKVKTTNVTTGDQSIGLIGNVDSLFGSDGKDQITVGATLHVGALQAKGTYTATFPITVAYN